MCYICETNEGKELAKSMVDDLLNSGKFKNREEVYMAMDAVHEEPFIRLTDQEIVEVVQARLWPDVGSAQKLQSQGFMWSVIRGSFVEIEVNTTIPKIIVPSL